MPGNEGRAMVVTCKEANQRPILATFEIMIHFDELP